MLSNTVMLLLCTPCGQFNLCSLILMWLLHNIQRKQFTEPLNSAATKLIKLCLFHQYSKRTLGFSDSFMTCFTLQDVAYLWFVLCNSFVLHQNACGQEEHRCQHNQEKIRHTENIYKILCVQP